MLAGIWHNSFAVDIHNQPHLLLRWPVEVIQGCKSTSQCQFSNKPQVETATTANCSVMIYLTAYHCLHHWQHVSASAVDSCAAAGPVLNDCRDNHCAA